MPHQSDPISIFYNNGGNTAVQMYVWNGLKPVLWDGAVTFSGTISIGTVSGTLSNNAAAPAANNFGVLPAIVSTTALGYTSGRQVLLRVDTTGALIVSASISTAGLATDTNQTSGAQKTQIVDTTAATIGITGSPLVVSGTVTATVSTTSGLATSAKQDTGNTSLASIDSKLTNPLPVSITTSVAVTGPLTDTQLRASAVPVSGTLAVTSTTFATSANQTNGTQLAQVVNTTGTTQAFGAGTTTNTVIRVVLPTDQTSIPVTGTVTATVSTTSGLATSANQTGGNQLAQIVNTTGNSIAFNNGVASTTTPRVTIASDNTVISGVVIGAANLATGQVTVATTATVIAATRATRRSITVVNGGGTAFYLGGSTVSTTTGVLVFGTIGAAITLNVTGTISGIVISGTEPVSYFEEYD